MSFLTALTLPRRDDAKQSDNDHKVRYEICAASEWAKVLLQTAQQVNDQLHSVRTLRRQRSSNLSESGKEWIDRAISHTSIAVSTTAHLAEPVPEHASGRRRRLPEASFLRYLRHLISDSSQVTAQLAQLSIASQSLNTAMSILLSCESHKSNSTREVTKTDRSQALGASLQELSELMNRRRKVNAAPVDYSLLPYSNISVFSQRRFCKSSDDKGRRRNESSGRFRKRCLRYLLNRLQVGPDYRSRGTVEENRGRGARNSHSKVLCRRAQRPAFRRPT
jgi:hypothetical protein